MTHGDIAGSAKAVYVELCCRYTGKSQREIASLLGYTSETSITKQRKRLKEKLDVNDQLKKRLKTLANEVALSIDASLLNLRISPDTSFLSRSDPAG